MIHRHTVVRGRMRQRANNGQLVGLTGRLWHLIAERDSRHCRGNRLERTADAFGRIRLHVPHILLRLSAPHEQKNARASRLLVEGVHDAELVEKVWGDDLRVEGVVVELLDGADNLQEIVRSFGPRSGRRLGVLLDHLVDNSKETRIAAGVDHPDVLVTGHPYVDIWAAVKPSVVGIAAWPEIPKGQPWKEGICAALGVDDPRLFWKKILNSVSSYSDLQPPLVGAVEQLIDFVTEPS